MEELLDLDDFPTVGVTPFDVWYSQLLALIAIQGQCDWSDLLSGVNPETLRPLFESGTSVEEAAGQWRIHCKTLFGGSPEDARATSDLVRRTWCYLKPPNAYQMAACSCGREATRWSEFENHLWCDHCKKDFIPAHNGMLDGPLPLGVASLMGVTFDRINIDTLAIERFDVATLTFRPEVPRE